MPKINTAASNHEAPAGTAKWKFLPYTKDERRQHATLIRAIKIIDKRIKGYRPCNAAFEELPGGKTFAAIWKDPNIWISYDPEYKVGKFGATVRGKKEITISKYAFRGGDHWTVAATLIHELAHVNGAPGNDTQAEDTLKSCLLKDLHDPNIIGKVTSKPRRVTAYA